MYEEIGALLSQENSKQVLLRRSFRSSYGLLAVTGLLAVVSVKILLLMEVFGLGSRLVAILPIIPLLEIVRRYYNDIYILTRDRVTHYAGRISLRFSVPSVRCIDLRAITVSQGIIGRMLNFGNVELSTAAQDGNELIIKGVISPQALAKVIDNLRQHSQKAVMENATEQARTQITQGD